MQILNDYGLQAIETKYLGPTNYRGSRVKATAQAGSVTIEWDDSVNSDENHDRAALNLAHQLDWDRDDTDLVRGGRANGTGNVYVMLSQRMQAAA